MKNKKAKTEISFMFLLMIMVMVYVMDFGGIKETINSAFSPPTATASLYAQDGNGIHQQADIDSHNGIEIAKENTFSFFKEYGYFILGIISVGLILGLLYYNTRPKIMELKK